jgi:hypothetical protein
MLGKVVRGLLYFKVGMESPITTTLPLYGGGSFFGGTNSKKVKKESASKLDKFDPSKMIRQQPSTMVIIEQ